MATGRIRGITIEIGGDTTKLVKALTNVDNAISKTQQNLRDIDRALKFDPSNTNLLRDKQKELAAEIGNVESKLKTEKEALEQMKNAPGFDENSQKARDLQVQIDLDTAALKRLKDEANASKSVVGSAFQAIGEQVKEAGQKIKGVGDDIKKVGTDLTQKVTVPIAAAFGGSAKAAIDWESAFTGVMKTVDETSTTTYDDLKNGINEIAKTTASSQNEIAAVMEIAGQLGVSADNAVEFTKIMVELGDTTNLSSEEAASSIAKFANVTNMSLQDVDKLGAVIVDLGNNYATTEADIMNMATRLSGAGAQIGLSQGEILGLATALSSVGIEAEMGGSAFSKAMVKMQVAVETGFDQVNEVTQKAGMSLRDLELMSTNDTKGFKELAQSLGMTTTEIKEVITNGNNLNNFAQVAGVSTEEFVKLYKDDAPAALQAFITGLGDTETKGESTIAMLQEMGFTEVRLRDTLTRLANSEGLVTEAMTQGNEAWDENAALSEEAEKRYATMEAQIQQCKNSITELAVEIGEMLMPYIQQGIEFVQQLIEKWKGLDDSQKELILKIAAIAAVVGPVLVVIGSVVSAIGTIISVIGGAISAIGTIITVLSGPVGIILLIVAALAALGIAIYKNWDAIKEWAQGIANTVKEKWEEAKKAVSDKVNEIKENVSNKWQEIKEGVANSQIGQAVGTVWQAAKDTMQEKLDKIKEAYDKHGGGLKGAAAGAIEAVKGYYSAGFTFIDKLTGGKLSNMLNTVKTKMSDIKNDISTKWNNIKTDVQTKINGIKDNVTNTFNNIKTSISTTVSNIKTAIINGFSNAVDYIKNLPSQAWSWGADIINNVIDGIRDKIGGVVDAVSDVAETIASYLHFSEPDVGPLKDFHTFMPDMMKEMVNGIEKGIPKLESTVNSMADTLSPVNGVAGTNNSLTANNTFNITVNGADKDVYQLANELTDIIQDNINSQIYNKEAVFA